MFKTLAIAVVVALAALLVVAAVRPDSFRVERSVRIQAPPERLFALINDLQSFNSWNPYVRKDPHIKGSYSGPSSGRGASYAFEGNKEVGTGRIGITDSAAPSAVTLSLDMIEPFAAHNTVEFTLHPEGEATTVKWAMHGPSPYLARLIGLFVDMDGMIGKDFEAGLANLKRVAER